MDHILGIAAGAKDLLPITVVAAIVIFLAKEGLETWRRHEANGRKRTALRRLIADEIERNNWAMRRLRDCLFQIERAIIEGDSKLTVGVGSFGDRYLRREGSDGSVSQMPFGRVHGDVLSKNLLELAIVDGQKFECALGASDAIKELEHVLLSMIENIAHEADPLILEGFVEYARDEVSDAEKTLASFYRSITGQSLREHRLR